MLKKRTSQTFKWSSIRTLPGPPVPGTANIAIFKTTKAAAIRFFLERWAHRLPSCQTVLITTKISMLKALLPTMLPAARGNKPFRIAVMDDDISGNEVAKANKVVPTKVLPRPVYLAISSTDETKKGEAKKMSIVPETKLRAGFNKRREAFS